MRPKLLKVLINLSDCCHNLCFRIMCWYWQKPTFPNTTCRYYWYSWTTHFLSYLHKFLLNPWRNLNLTNCWPAPEPHRKAEDTQMPTEKHKFPSASLDYFTLLNPFFSNELGRVHTALPKHFIWTNSAPALSPRTLFRAVCWTAQQILCNYDPKGCSEANH